MQQISRDQAEKLFEEYEVTKSLVEQNADELRISFNLSNLNSILVVYNVSQHIESFFLNDLDLK